MLSIHEQKIMHNHLAITTSNVYHILSMIGHPTDQISDFGMKFSFSIDSKTVLDNIRPRPSRSSGS